MKWSFGIGSLAGIPVRVHATFFLLLLFVAWSHASGGPAAMIQGVVFILLLFACVVLHELGHSLAGRRFGYRVRDITLLPIGGVASFERLPTNPRQELIIAIAGPAVNVALAGLLYVLLFLTNSFVPLERLGIAQGSILERLLVVNLFLALFNLLPAFPMDGGRMLRAILAQRMDYAAATQRAARIGQGMALLLGFVGLLGNPILIFIALFVYMGAEQEAAAALMRSMFHGLKVRAAMVTRFATLEANEPVSAGLSKLLEGYQHDFPVVTVDGKVLGVLTRSLLLEALARGNETAPAADVVRTADAKDGAMLTPDSPLDDAIERLRASGSGSLPILDRDKLVGLLTLENVGELVMIHNARAKAQATQPSRPLSL
jgi:Zn-dependent protease/CBS domain-containing protein